MFDKEHISLSFKKKIFFDAFLPLKRRIRNEKNATSYLGGRIFY